MESEISGLLLHPGGASRRAELLACVDDYSRAAIREAHALGPTMPSTDECARALEWLTRPVFICGHHRSGTTMLQSLLDGHPQLLMLPNEATYFTSFAYVARAAPTSAALDRFAAEWIARFVDPNFEPHFRLGRVGAERSPCVDFARALFGWNAALRGRARPNLIALLALAAAFKATTAKESIPLLWVEKTPQNEQCVGGLAGLERARFVQLVRDPRSTLASLKETYRTNGRARFDAAEHARAIGRSLRLAVENQSLLRHRYLVVRYEDLVERTDREVERVRRFLEIAPDASLLRPTAGGIAVRANSSFGAPVPGVIDPLRGPATLTAEDSALLGTYAADAANPFGYAIPAPEPLARVILRARHSPGHGLRSGRNALRAIMRTLRR